MDKSVEIDLLRLEVFQVNYKRIYQFWVNTVLRGTFWCLYWNNAPDAGVRFGSTRTPLVPDRIYLLSPNANLRTYCDSKTVEQLYCHFYLPGCESPEKLLPLPITPELEALRSRTLAETRTGSPLRFFSALSLIGGALHALPAEKLRLRVSSPEMNGIEQFILARLGSDLDVEALAAHCHLSEREFSRWFRNSFGMTPYAWIIARRCERAAMMLRSSGESIESICGATGFRDRNYFTRIFTRRFGVPPVRYRRENS